MTRNSTNCWNLWIWTVKTKSFCKDQYRKGPTNKQNPSKFKIMSQPQKKLWIYLRKKLFKYVCLIGMRSNGDAASLNHCWIFLAPKIKAYQILLSMNIDVMVETYSHLLICLLYIFLHSKLFHKIKY